MKLATLCAGAIAVCAAAVQADPIFIFERSAGSFEVTAEDGFSRTIHFESTVDFEVGGLGITVIEGDFVQTFTGGDFDTIAGSAVFVGASNLDTLSVDFTGTLTDDGFASLAGDWDLTGSTGAYAVYTSGSGNNSASYFFTDDDGGPFFAIFQGTLVPAPSSLAMLGIGALAASRRRRG